jgi:hypothetical protein
MSKLTSVQSRVAGARGAPARRRGRAGWLAAACAAALCLAPPLAHADITVTLVPSRPVVAPGDTFSIYVVIPIAGAQFNAFDASLHFDADRVSYESSLAVADQRGDLVTAACTNTFHRFDVAPDSLRISLSLLCNQVFMTGPGRIYRVVFRAGSTLGSTFFALGTFTQFYRAGLYVRPVHAGYVTVRIGSPTTDVGPGPQGTPGLDLAPPAPNPGRSGGSMLLDFRLPDRDVVAIEILDLQGRRLALRSAEPFGAGRHRLTWSPPALPSGDYFVRLRAGSGLAVRRWTVLR